MPAAPATAARRGTDFHAWVEAHYTQAAMLDLADLTEPAAWTLAADGAGPSEADQLARMQANFLASEWSGRSPEAVEVAVETVVDGLAIRGRIDAVFADPDGLVTIVDWKTGAPPRGAQAQARAAQLAAYRLAYARLRGLPLDRVRGAFFYAATGETVWPELVDEAGLSAVLAAIPDR
ncbi:hypothetical protein GCM10025862_05020 [Arsenicicoccus piscis]|uniref:PD-(D/E)XK endonuclease-like domain-containing protein n=2 Tax=Arsenicicoccus piscis TaxID=673954 RepID=A0ABQ6HJ53_9MICO|nr:PD-(D/E)XK nuclease family protein [Arsenicicoccus piscis]GMA18481.1 hypothetical protein GCM10025862_05020 [Arsenicicoccus piscis]